MMPTLRKLGRKPRTHSVLGMRRSPRPSSGEATATAENPSPRSGKPMASPTALTARKPPSAGRGGADMAKPKQRHTEVCYCSAYKFPHRAGSGKCQGPGELLCSACGEVAEGTSVDFGIGAYEYWGSKGVDRNVQWVSRCCEASLLENTPNKPEASPPEPDYD